MPGRGALAAALAAGCVALSLSGCGSSVADSAVTLTGVRDAYVVPVTGAERPASDGQKLGKGDRVRTGAAGTATLGVRGRLVVLGPATEVGAPDGATVVLSRGSVLVDRRRGPGLTLSAGDTTVDDVSAGAVRVERSYSVQVAALSARVRVRTAAGATLRLPALFQVVAAGRALPAAGTVLHLRHDAWERSVIPGVVEDDQRLNDIAAGLDTAGAVVVPAAYVPAPGGHASDGLLADAIGRAAGRDDTRRAAAAAKARAWRGAGGSWGVVAALLKTSVADVGSAVADLLHGVPAPSASPTPAPNAPVAGRSPQPGVSPTPQPTQQPTRNPGTPGNSRPPSTRPPTSPPTSESITDQVKDIIPTPLLPLVDSLIG
jgi:hypothetical protein